MKQLLVTGSSGLTGSAVKELFTEKGWNVIGLDANLRAKFFGLDTPKDPNTLDIDIRNFVDVEDLFSSMKFDAIVHCAAQPSHDYATDNVLEDFSINAMGTLNLLEATRKTSSEAVFVHMSTDKVYGENMSFDAPICEADTRYIPPIPYKEFQGFKEDLGLDFAGDRSFFGCSKAAADMYAQQYAARGMKVAIFRPGCITGRNHVGAEAHGFLAYLSKCIKNGTTYKIFGNGKNVRDNIHANDVASACFSFINAPRNLGVYNLGGGPERAVSVIEAGELLSKAIGKPFLHEFHKARLGDRLWDVHDVSKFRRDYPEWDYEYSLEDIINELAEI